MISAGWVMMIVSLTFVLGLVVFCFHRVMTVPEPPDLPDDDSEIHLAGGED